MQIENHKEEVPFEHYAEKFRALDPQEASRRTGAAFDPERGRSASRCSATPIGSPTRSSPSPARAERP